MNNLTSASNALSQFSPIRQAYELASRHPYYACLAAIGLIANQTAAYLSSIRNAAVPNEAVAARLIAFYTNLPVDPKPKIQGNSLIEQGVWIKNWILSCRDLQLNNKGMHTLPPEIGLFVNLKGLDLSYNRLTKIPPEIGNLQALRVLNLEHNQFVEFPPEIGNLKALQQLDLSDNRLVTLSPEIGTFQALRKLYLENNQLATLPPEIGNLQALQQLILLRNHLVTLPSEIGNLQALRVVSFEQNRLVALPPEIGNLQALQILKLEQNQLAALPPQIGNLQALQQLGLWHNQLTTFPPEIGNLQTLQLLSFEQNRLVALPPEIYQLSEQCTVDARVNPLDQTTLEQFLEGLTLHRTTHPGEGPIIMFRHGPNASLPAQIQSWSAEFEAAFPDQQRPPTDFTPLTSLNGEHANNLREYLTNLRTIKDYREPVPDDHTITPQNNVIRRVENMLQLACANPIFKEKMLALIAEGLTNCDDRKLVIFNDIEIEYQFHLKEMSDREFIPLAQGASMYNLLKQHAIKIANKNNFRDVVEVILGYHIGVQKRGNVSLPITTREMGHPEASPVTSRMLEEAEKLILRYNPTQQLERSLHWQQRMSERYPKEADLTETKFGKLFSAAKKFDQDCGFRASPEEKKLWVDAWLKKHPEHHELQGVLLDASLKDYTQAVDAISELRGIALAHLGNDLVRYLPRPVERKT